MLIESVEVRSFRTIRHVRIGLTKGLNVIHGDNDAGKSTLMDAIRACLTVRARGTGSRYAAMRPRTGGDPEVCVVFTKDEVRYEVHKRFGPRGTVHLNIRTATGPSRDLSGDDAEQALRSALGVSDEPSRRSADLGILPILWVEQGTSRELPTVEGHGAATLAECLSALSGEVIAGENGEAIFNAIEARYNETFSARGPRAGSPLQLALEACDSARAEVASLEGRRRMLEATAARFDDVTVRLHSVQASLPGLADAAAAVERELEERREQERAREKAAADLSLASVLVDQAADRHVRRIADRQDLLQARQRVEAMQCAHDEAVERLAAHEAGRPAEEASLTAAASAESRLRQEAEEAERRAVRSEALRDLKKLDEQLERAREFSRDEREAAQRVAAETIDDGKLAEVERLEREADLASASLRASSTTIEVKAFTPTSIRLDDESLAVSPGEGVDRTLSAATTLRVGDALEVSIVPGGEDLARRRARAETARCALVSALEVVSAGDIREVRVRAAARRESWQARALAAQLLERTAPDGISALEMVRVEIVARLEGGTELPAEELDAASARRAASAALEVLTEARGATERARNAHAAFDAHCERLRADLRVAVEALTGAKQTADRAETTLMASISACGSDEALERAHADAIASRRALDEHVKSLTRLLSEPLTHAEARVKRARSALEAARTDEQRLSQESYRLEVDLQSADTLGLDDRLAAAHSRLAEAEGEQRRTQARADALRLLYEMFCEQRTAARRRFLAPLHRQIEPLLQVLYPGSQLELDEHFGVTRVERVLDGAHDFEDLGGGSKEQLAILVRLAMARTLGGGQPLPVMLDDAIVFSSEARFARMASVLVAASSDLQLLVFTCHWDRYREIGADNVVDLEDVRARDERSPKTAA